MARRKPIPGGSTEKSLFPMSTAVTMLACNTYLQSIVYMRQDLKLGCSGDVDKCNRPNTLYKAWFVNKDFLSFKSIVLHIISNNPYYRALIFNTLQTIRYTKPEELNRCTGSDRNESQLKINNKIIILNFTTSNY